ncbi:hypothetical protein AB1A73_005784 [Klebsiella pneumoniae]
MKSVFRLLPFLFLLGLSAYLPGVRAETCRANIGQTTVNIPNIKYLPTLPVSIDIAALNVDIGSSGSCQVATSTIQVSLGTVNRGEFHGKGTTGGQAKRFSIPVFCPTPTDVRIGFFGVSVESDTLALSQASNSASGVGVKLTYGNNPGAAVPDGTSVKINEASNLPILKRVTGASAGTAEAINFNAQYVQTDATVGAGTANSMVTFALEYN